MNSEISPQVRKEPIISTEPTFYVEPVQDVPTANVIPVVTYKEVYTSVPMIIQQDYADIRYGNYGTVSTHGCGICSVAMVLSYLLDEDVSPVTLAQKYGGCNTQDGSDWKLFNKTAKAYGFEEVFLATSKEEVFLALKEGHVVRVHDWRLVLPALKEGHVVVANARKKTIFTTSGHYIVLTGVTEEGRILVNDPNIYSYPNKHNNYGEWLHDALYEGLVPVGIDLKAINEYSSYSDWLNDALNAGCERRGFDVEYMKYGYGAWWIYPQKDLHANAERQREAALIAEIQS